VVLNAELPQENNLNIYSNALFNYRDSKASAFFRPPDSTKQTKYPNGFLPIINANILDYSFSLGVKGEFDDGVYWDLSNTYGYNNFKFLVEDSMNYALGTPSPSSFSNGNLSFLQNTTNLDLKTTINKLDLAGGIEYRYENYKIAAGDEASYYHGGSQGFSGFRPENETDSSRGSYAVYLDSTYNFVKDFSLEGAARYENFSDFGSTINVKLATAYKIIPEFLLRSSASTGFRAPSLSQSNYSQTSSFLSGGSVITQGILKPDNVVSQLFGAKALKPEKSKHFSLGGVYQPLKDLSIMIDYFYAKIGDRIMLSDTFTLSPADKVRYGMSKVSFFTNAIDTKTQGIDIKLNYKHTFEDNAKIAVITWYNHSKNKVVSFNTDATSRESSFKEIDKIENGQPKDSIRFLTNYSKNAYNIALNLSRYGSYRQVVSGTAYDFDPIITTDLEVSYKITKSVNMAIGGNNIFDAMPNKFKNLSGIAYGNDGILPYSNYAPLGFSGAFYYAKISLEF